MEVFVTRLKNLLTHFKMFLLNELAIALLSYTSVSIRYTSQPEA